MIQFLVQSTSISPIFDTLDYTCNQKPLIKLFLENEIDSFIFQQTEFNQPYTNNTKRPNSISQLQFESHNERETTSSSIKIISLQYDPMKFSNLSTFCSNNNFKTIFNAENLLNRQTEHKTFHPHSLCMKLFLSHPNSSNITHLIVSTRTKAVEVIS